MVDEIEHTNFTYIKQIDGSRYVGSLAFKSSGIIFRGKSVFSHQDELCVIAPTNVTKATLLLSREDNRANVRTLIFDTNSHGSSDSFLFRKELSHSDMASITTILKSININLISESYSSKGHNWGSLSLTSLGLSMLSVTENNEPAEPLIDLPLLSIVEVEDNQCQLNLIFNENEDALDADEVILARASLILPSSSQEQDAASLSEAIRTSANLQSSASATLASIKSIKTENPSRSNVFTFTKDTLILKAAQLTSYLPYSNIKQITILGSPEDNMFLLLTFKDAINLQANRSQPQNYLFISCNKSTYSEVPINESASLPDGINISSLINVEHSADNFPSISIKTTSGAQNETLLTGIQHEVLLTLIRFVSPEIIFQYGEEIVEGSSLSSTTCTYSNVSVFLFATKSSLLIGPKHYTRIPYKILEKVNVSEVHQGAQRISSIVLRVNTGNGIETFTLSNVVPEFAKLFTHYLDTKGVSCETSFVNTRSGISNIDDIANMESEDVSEDVDFAPESEEESEDSLEFEPVVKQSLPEDDVDFISEDSEMSFETWKANRS